MREKIETKINPERTEINIDNAKFIFCSDESISDWYEEKLFSLGERDEWIQKNIEMLTAEKEKIERAVQEGIIPNSKPETIFEFKKKQLSKNPKRVIETKKLIEDNIEFLKEEVKKRLVEFIPEWKLRDAEIEFKMSESADYCIWEGRRIEVDLGRLSNAENPIESAIAGVTHEIFHIWMGEEKMKDNAGSRDIIVSGTVNEGLAILVSNGGDYLRDHYIRRGEDYNTVVKESLDVFEEILEGADEERLKGLEESGFRNLGVFYVAGYEIAKKVLENLGLERFKEMIKKIRKNPYLLIEEYRKL